MDLLLKDKIWEKLRLNPKLLLNKEKKMTVQKQPGVPPGQHNVKDGETLWDIAQVYYGDGNQWQKITAANGGITPESLKIGQNLTIPG